MVTILQRHESLLRQKAALVPLADIGSKKIAGIIDDMRIAMYSQKDGIAIAAPQIAQLLCIFMVSGSLLKKVDPEYKGPEQDLIFINPTLTRLSKEKEEMEEGCLSVRWLYGRVKRSTRVTLNGYNEHGKAVRRGASGLLAQIFQHEVDHLHGVLFTDRTDDVVEMTEEEVARMNKDE